MINTFFCLKRFPSRFTSFIIFNRIMLFLTYNIIKVARLVFLGGIPPKFEH